jgi:hypothetical protein
LVFATRKINRSERTIQYAEFVARRFSPPVFGRRPKWPPDNAESIILESLHQSRL